MTKTANILKHFNLYSKAYLEAYGEVLQEATTKNPDEMLFWLGKLLDIKENDSILDCGSGYGCPASFFSSRFNCNVLGLNIIEFQLIYSQKYNSAKCNFIEFDFNDIDKLPVGFKPDKIVFLETFGYAEKPKELLRKCADIIPQNGKILIKSLCLPNTKDEEILKDIDAFYWYDFHQISDILKMAYDVGLHPLLLTEANLGTYEKTAKFLDLVKKSFKADIRLYPYILILHKI